MNSLVPPVEKAISKIKRTKPKKAPKVFNLSSTRRAQVKFIEPIPKYIDTIQITQFSKVKSHDFLIYRTCQ